MIRRAHTDEDRLLSREWAAPLPGLAALGCYIMRRVRIECEKNQN